MLAKNGDEVAWTVIITQPRLLEMWEYWMAEKTTELVNLLDFDNLDPASKSALATVRSVNAKISQARANPIWDLVTLSGNVAENDEQWFIKGDQGEYRITGSRLEELKALKGKPVVAKGYVKVRGQFQVLKFQRKKENTLELFVMSLCPFSERAEASIIRFLDSYSRNPRPSLEVHYIFYKKTRDGKTVFTSLHGDKEIQENLVQMLIRDAHPDALHDYLLMRVESDEPWQALVERVGLTPEQIDLIAGRIKKDRDSLIEKEYAYVAGLHGIRDGSPTYLWESERVRDIRQIPAFAKLQSPSEQCDESE